jgi:glycosyltransferase involved in cell wall biosynthesis
VTRWAILTGEYPPQPGGVADYTYQVASGLAAAGDRVSVFAPSQSLGKEWAHSAIELVRLPDHFGPRGLATIERALERRPVDRLLIQYVPHAYGWKAMNLPFAIWVAARAGRFAPVWVMFHEVAFPLRAWPPTHTLLGTVHRVMARLVAGAADRSFSASAAWGPLLRRLCPSARAVEWLPIPSNVPDDAEITPVRTVPGTAIGHFGTYGPATTDLLEPTLLALLSRQNRSAILLGRGGIGFRERVTARHPQLSGQLIALGELPARELTSRLRGCEVLLQPYIDGISSRRGSSMAGLANGVPLVSNLGEHSESLWKEVGCVALAQAPDSAALVAATEAILAMTPTERVIMGQQAAALYRARFGLDNTVTRLRNSLERSRA